MIATLKHAFAPTGTLRAAINLGNPILAGTHPDTKEPQGVSIDLANALATELGCPLELVVVTTAAQSVQAVTEDRADVGFFAIDPVRGEHLQFTAPYLLIEGAYMVRNESPINRNEDVDQPGLRVTVGKGSAYDLFLSRELKQADIVRAPSSPEVVDVFLRDQIPVAAGVKQQLEADAQRLGGLRLLPGHFMLIQQAMGLSRQRPVEALAALHDFIERHKRSGFIDQALQRHSIQGVSVAPAA